MTKYQQVADADAASGADEIEREQRASPATCDHDYECTYEGMDGERHRCTKCRDSYFLDYDEMR